jgi:hypothetical protein
MYVKRMASAAAIAASVGMSGLTVGVGVANAAPPPSPPPCNTPGCQPGGAGQGAPNAQGGQPADRPDNHGTPPQQGGPNNPGTPPQQGGPNNNGTPPQNGPNNLAEPNHQNGPNNQGGPQQNGPNDQNAPNGRFSRGDAQHGGPTDTPRGFSTPGNGAPMAPRQGDHGWNDGPPPGGPPPNWDGPPPPGGWNGPPPPGGWNRHWDGPQRDMDQARFDHQPFNWNGYEADPTYDPDLGWGFWFFGLWIPL